VIDRITAVIVLRPDGAALLQHRDDKPGLRNAGKWAPPGGHLEPGESEIDGARRELQEETDYVARDLKLLCSFQNEIEGWPPYNLTIFWCWYDGVQPVACHEGQALAFIERSAAAAYEIPPYLLDAWDDAIAAANLVPKDMDADHA
jgi:ADP-ribose pyrophosphatase YjhB (NUDIX family)